MLARVALWSCTCGLWYLVLFVILGPRVYGLVRC